MDPTPPPAILHVVDSLEFGGLERVVADLAIAQAATGRNVSVFSIDETAGFRSELERAGIPVIVGGKQGSLDLGVLRCLRASAKAMGTGIVHTHNFVPSYYAALALAGVRDAILVNTCHNMGTRLAATRLRFLYRWSLSRSQRVAMVGRQVHDRLASLGIAPTARTDVVLNGIPLARHQDSVEARAHAREKLGFDRHALVIGCVGRLVALKNHALLVDQMPALLAEFPRLRLVLVGDGPLASELRGRTEMLDVADRVSILGARDDVDVLLPGFDVFALPSLTEGLSIALLEACAAGRAIVASAVGGNPEVVTDGVTGLLVAPTDGDALRAALRTLLADAGLRARLGAAARDWVESEGSIDAMVGRYDAFYALATAAGARRRR